jgi:hypothetical protein
MKLYKYRSLDNLWHTLDIVVNQRIYCAHWTELNDPLEGRYEIFLGTKNKAAESIMMGHIEEARNAMRVASLSADPTNFLMWSHYANGHKGIAIEIEVPGDYEYLAEVTYTPFTSVFSEKADIARDMRHLFTGKSEEWSYEKEFRLIANKKFLDLPNPCERILVGPLIDKNQEKILRNILPKSVEMVRMKLDRTQGSLAITSPKVAMPILPAILRY